MKIIYLEAPRNGYPVKDQKRVPVTWKAHDGNGLVLLNKIPLPFHLIMRVVDHQLTVIQLFHEHLQLSLAHGWNTIILEEIIMVYNRG